MEVPLWVERDEPEQIYEAYALLQEIVEYTLELPSRQQMAMICVLRERVDPQLLETTFLQQGMDIRCIHWPEQKADKQLLKVSFQHARRRLSHYLIEQGYEIA